MSRPYLLRVYIPAHVVSTCFEPHWRRVMRAMSSSHLSVRALDLQVHSDALCSVRSFLLLIAMPGAPFVGVPSLLVSRARSPVRSFFVPSIDAPCS